MTDSPARQRVEVEGTTWAEFLDGRQRNNLSLAQRRKAAKAGRRRKTRKKDDTLAKAKDVLRRTGRTVFDARIESPQFKGTVIVDTRRMDPAAVIELAEQVLLREHARNCELRAEHGLPPLPKPSLKGN